jgi:signal peptidase I
MLDQPWKIGLLVIALLVARVIWGVWPKAPGRRAMIELLDSGLIAVVLVFVLVRPFVVQAFHIPTGSMEPHLMPRDRILVNKFVYRLNPVRRGDIIVFRAPEEAAGPGQQKDFVKRVIGLPGDRIQIRRGEGVYINGRLLAEPPGVPTPNYSWPINGLGRPGEDPYLVPGGCYFVLGDNRNNSRDSHAWVDADGRPHPFVEEERLQGKALAIFWPPSRIRLVGDHRDVGVPELDTPLGDVGI